MAHRYKVGDTVTWNSHGGEVEGRIVKIATENGTIREFDYKASKDDPRYIIETGEGKYAAHTEDALRKA